MAVGSLKSLEFLLVPAFGAGVVVFLNVFLCRVLRGLGAYRGQAIGIIGGLTIVGSLLLLFSFDTETLGRSAAAMLIFVAFCYVYFHFNNMGETARRIRLLRELTEASTPLALPEISIRYGAGVMLTRRIERLMASGQVQLHRGRYSIANRSVFFMAVLVGYAHRIVFGKFRTNRLES